ncbi:MAG: O-antigen ligase family protein [Bacteroidia bacterium]|nr:O-antigen ligase family protein [Bacteroidia bacterium]
MERQLIATISETKIRSLDFSMLIIMWLLIFSSSIIDLGLLPATLFVLFNIVLVMRNNSNSLLVLLLIYFTPSASLGIPRVFVCSTCIAICKYFFIDLLFKKTKLPRLNYVVYTAFLFVFYITLTLFIVPNIDLAFLYYQKYIEGLILLVVFFTMVNKRESLGIIFKWWVFVAGLSLLVRLAHFYLGENSHLFKSMSEIEVPAFNFADKLTYNISGRNVYRILWPGEEPNYTSASLIFPFAVALGFSSISKSKMKYFWTTISCMIFISILTTHSRSGFLSAIVIFGLSGLFFLRSGVKTIIPIVLVFIASIILLFIMPDIHERIFGINSTIVEGASGRFLLWKLGLDMWSESPLWGKGLTAFYYQYNDAVHNTYIQVLAETGLIGFGLFIMVIIVSLRASYKLKTLYSDIDNPDIQFSRSLIFGNIGASYMISTLTYQDISLFWLMCGSCASMYFLTKRDLKVFGYTGQNMFC